ncbi:hypothetical protein G6F57_020451 [Rhizopus arrhizus]|nr:hypothetical protein G6F57_020451 [Rhizopus arrhizus]
MPLTVSDGRRVADPAFAFDHRRQPLGRTAYAEDAHHRDRVGRGDDGAQQQADHEAVGGDRVQRHPDHHRTYHHGHDGHHQDGADVVHQAAHVHRQRRLEQQHRQEHHQEGFRRDLEAFQRIEEVADPAGRPAVHVNDDAQQTADDSQQHRVRQLEAAGQRWHEADQCEQTGQAENKKTYIHG